MFYEVGGRERDWHIVFKLVKNFKYLMIIIYGYQ